MSIGIRILNHAACLYELPGGVRLLTDPWFSGTCFKDGWGLMFENPEAIELASTATHLWISHFHGDHMHAPTLKALAARCPGIEVLANDSANFQMSPALRAMGFKNIVTLRERVAHALTPQVTLFRVPATGIDNMLFVRAEGQTLLNYNDCNLPKSAIRSLNRKFGPVDILMTNYNHAGKQMDFPDADPKIILRRQLSTFQSTIDCWQAKFAVPFASLHYYRSPESQIQNESLLSIEQLTALGPQILESRVGDHFLCVKNQTPIRTVLSHPVKFTVQTQTPAGESQDRAELLQQARAAMSRLRNQYFGLSVLIPRARIRVRDLEASLDFKFFPGRVEWVATGSEDAIEATSKNLMIWLSDRYGTEGFVIGSHFRLLSQHQLGIKVFFLLCLFIENNLSPWKILKLLLRPAGWRFFWNRREEIYGILSNFSFRFGSRS